MSISLFDTNIFDPIIFDVEYKTSPMLALPPAVFRAANRLDQDSPWLVLLDINIENQPTLRIVNNTEDVVFQGHNYTAFSFTIDRPKESSKGEIPSLQLAVANATRSLQLYVEQFNGGVGSSVTMIVISEGNKDEDYAELTATLTIMSCKCTAQWVTFTLGAVNPLNKKHPSEQYIALHCRFGYTDDPRCGYTGPLATCSRTLADCKAHGNQSRFGGHPGLDGRGIRLV